MRFLTICFTSFFALALVQCSTQNSLCSKEAECENWNSARQDACEEELEGADEIASEYDCEEQFSSLVSCMDDTAVCKPDPKGNKFETNCRVQQEALSSCQKIAREKVD